MKMSQIQILSLSIIVFKILEHQNCNNPAPAMTSNNRATSKRTKDDSLDTCIKNPVHISHNLRNYDDQHHSSMI